MMRHQHKKALRRGLGAGLGLLLTSGLLAARSAYVANEVTATVTPSRLYVTEQGANTLAVIDPTSLKVTATVNVGNSPYGVAADT
jgi:YVTN family beta-propeller protein